MFLVKVQHALRASSVNDRQFCFRAVESSVFVLRVPDQVTPQLTVGILASHGVDGLDEGIPCSVFRWRSLPVIVPFIRVTDKGDG